MTTERPIMIPEKLHFIVVNIGAFNALGVVDKRIITINLTQSQRKQLSDAISKDDSYFDVSYSISEL